MAPWPAGGNWRPHAWFLPGRSVPLGIALSPTAPRDPASQKSAQESEGEERLRRRLSQTAAPRLLAAADTSGADAAVGVVHGGTRSLHARLLPGAARVQGGLGGQRSCAHADVHGFRDGSGLRGVRADRGETERPVPHLQTVLVPGRDGGRR